MGLIHIGADQDQDARGAFSIYIPETYDGSESWPLVVALHGGNGHGRDFIWTWLREARSRRFLLLAPSSLGMTWHLEKAATDSVGLHRAIVYVADRWKVDHERILLTGISDGGTYALTSGLQSDTPFTALALVTGVLPPVDLNQAPGRRILWIHGAHDWMFPVQRARQGFAILQKAGAEARLEIIDDLSHAYPREKNDLILKWFDPRCGRN